jgi:Arc/MetJ family transcription regulator
MNTDRLKRVFDETLMLLLTGIKALAAHFHGYEGITIDRPEDPDDEGDNTKRIIIRKNDEILYEATGDGGKDTLSKVILTILETEGVQKAGPNHPDCPVCLYLSHCLTQHIDVLDRVVGEIQRNLMVDAVKLAVDLNLTDSMKPEEAREKLAGALEKMGINAKVVAGGLDGMVDRDEFLSARRDFSKKYAAEQGWGDDLEKLSMDQIMEIRTQEGWKDPLPRKNADPPAPEESAS